MPLRFEQPFLVFKMTRGDFEYYKEHELVDSGADRLFGIRVEITDE